MYWNVHGSPVSTETSNSFTVSPPHAASSDVPCAISQEYSSFPYFDLPFRQAAPTSYISSHIPTTGISNHSRTGYYKTHQSPRPPLHHPRCQDWTSLDATLPVSFFYLSTPSSQSNPRTPTPKCTTSTSMFTSPSPHSLKTPEVRHFYSVLCLVIFISCSKRPSTFVESLWSSPVRNPLCSGDAGPWRKKEALGLRVWGGVPSLNPL